VEPEPLLKLRMEGGRTIGTGPSLGEIRAGLSRELDAFDDSYKRFLNPHIYKVSVTEKLHTLKLELIKNYLEDL
jgi:nicotinate phosphoribosyltransferase